MRCEPFLVTLALVGFSADALAGDAVFTGAWSIDLRTPDEKAAKVECGGAGFKLVQTGNRVVGDHWFVTAGCGRQNEGGDGTVRGVVIGTTAVLVVTSGRNGAIVLGTAALDRRRLKWTYLEEILPGEPEGDSPLILNSAVLEPEASEIGAEQSNLTTRSSRP